MQLVANSPTELATYLVIHSYMYTYIYIYTYRYILWFVCIYFISGSFISFVCICRGKSLLGSMYVYAYWVRTVCAVAHCCLTVCLSHAGIVLKWLNLVTSNQCWKGAWLGSRGRCFENFGLQSYFSNGWCYTFWCVHCHGLLLHFVTLVLSLEREKGGSLNSYTVWPW